MKRPPNIPGAPTHEHRRSRAALRVAELAQRSELFFAHFEHRAQLPLPPAWLPADAEITRPRFVAGVLAEPKYQAFRHDLLVASFHPGHRAQWTAHELCHALVGFAYKPNATMLFHVLSAWLAELLPVALWYFFDEADVPRCARHRGQGPLFQSFCDACERAALAGPRERDAESERRMREGRKFVARELRAIARSRRIGKPEGTRFATIDLAEDAVQYAAAHAARLRAPEMERFSAQFFAQAQGLHASLESLEARVVELCAAISGEGRARRWAGGRFDWVAQDIGYRLLSLRAERGGELGRELDALIDALAAARSEPGVAACIDRYEQLFAATKRARLPTPERLFALGYGLPRGYGTDLAQLAEGIASACPSTAQALAHERGALVQAFAVADQSQPERTPLGRRFARYLKQASPGPCADLGAVEAAITHAARREPWADCLDALEARDTRVAPAPGVEIVMIEHDVLGATPARVRRAKRFAEARGLIVLRRAGQPVDVLEIPRALALSLASAQPGELLPDDLFAKQPTARDELLQAGALVPLAYAE